MIGALGGNMSIGVSVILRDRFSSNARKIAQEMDMLDKKARRLKEQQMRHARDVNVAGAMMGGVMLNTAAQWYKSGAEFKYTMKFVKTITGATGKEFEALEERVKSLAKTNIFSAEQMASAAQFMAMAGMSAKDITINLKAASDLAMSTQSQLGGKGGSADIMTNTMRAFNLEAAESARVADVLSKAVTSSNTNLFDLGEALKYSSSTAKTLNMSLEELVSLNMLMGDVGIQSSMSGTAVENMLRYITQASGFAGTKKQGEALKMLGMSKEDLVDARGNLKPIGDILKKISETTKGMGTSQANNIFKALFGVRGSRAAAPALRNLEKYNENLEKLRGSQGYADKTGQDMMDSAQGQLLKLQAQWELFKVSFMEAVAPLAGVIVKVLQVVVDILTKITSSPLGKWIVMLGTGFIVARTAAMAFRAIQLSIQLATMKNIQLFGQRVGTTIRGYNQMTAAAMRFNAAQGGGMGMGGMMGGGRTVYSRSGKAYAANSPQGRMIMQGKGGGRWGQFRGRMANMGGAMKGGLKGLGGRALGFMKGGLGMGLGMGLLGMGADYFGDSMGGYNTTSGGLMKTGGNVLSSAGTGAMLGSFFGPLGTALGGATGAIYGLISSLNAWGNNTVDMSATIKAAVDRANILQAARNQNLSVEERVSMLSAKKWEKDQRMWTGVDGGYQTSFLENDQMYDPGYGYMGSRQQFQQRDSSVMSKIVINIDGAAKMNEIIDQREQEEKLLNFVM